jgi:solute carrier family 35 protein E1
VKRTVWPSPKEKQATDLGHHAIQKPCSHDVALTGRFGVREIMSTTTVTGTGRRASISIRQPNWPQNNNKMASSPQSPLDKFPSYVDETLDTVPNSLGQPGQDDPWQARKAPITHLAWDPRTPSKHRPRKSISETISTIRTRKASMSANAQEIAEVLRAPVSYKLIVRELLTFTYDSRTYH